MVNIYDIADVHVRLWSSSNSCVACSVVCRIANLLLPATVLPDMQFVRGGGESVSRERRTLGPPYIIVIASFNKDTLL